MIAASAVVAEIVDTTALWETVVAAVISGIGVTVIFSIAIFGAARSGELGRDGRAAGAVGYGVLAVVSGLVCLAAITAGIIVMAT